DARDVAEVLDPVDRGDRRMVDGGEQPRFPLEPGEEGRVLRECVGEDLDRDVSPEARVARAVNLSHPALPERIQDLETAQSCPRLQGHEFAPAILCPAAALHLSMMIPASAVTAWPLGSLIVW